MHEPRGRGVRQIGGTDQVGAPDLDGVDAERVGAEVEHALHHERRGRPRHPAVGSRRCRVRRHRGHLAAIVLELVGAGQEPSRHERLEAGRPRGDGVRAGIAGGADVEGEQPAVRVEAGPDRVVMVARMRRGLHRLAPLLDPLHRPAQMHRQHTERDVFGIEDRLHAEAAADVGRDDADAILGQAEHLAQQMADEVRYLRGRPERELALARAPVRDATAALERRGALPVGAERPLDHRGGAGQR